MVPYKIFTFFKDETRVNFESQKTDFPYKGDLYIHVSGTIPNGLGIRGWVGAKYKDLTLINLETFAQSLNIGATGTYAVVGAEGFEKISAIISAGAAGNVTVIGKFVFAG